jgi:hypothetical protein
VDTWTRLQQVRTYLAALQEAAKAHVERDPDGRLARWIRWAERYVDLMDPLREVGTLPRDPEGWVRRPLNLEAFALTAPEKPPIP